MPYFLILIPVDHCLLIQGGYLYDLLPLDQ